MPSECLLTNADHVLTGLYTQTVTGFLRSLEKYGKVWNLIWVISRSGKVWKK